MSEHDECSKCWEPVEDCVCDLISEKKPYEHIYPTEIIQTHDDYFIPADFDNIISQPKPTKDQAIQTHHFGCVPIRAILTEKLETSRDRLFKINPSMRING